MNELIPFEQETIDNFCYEAGIKKVKSYIRNCETNEVRLYCQDSSKYRTPKGWKDIETGSFEEAIYPNLLRPENFMKLLGCHWDVFNNFGNYRSVGNEPFPVNYLLTRTKAIQTCKAMGGGEMLDTYLKAIKQIDFDYGVVK